MTDRHLHVHFYSRFLLAELGGGCRRELQLVTELEWLHPTFISAREGPALPTLPPAWTREGQAVRRWPPEIRAYVARLRRKARQWAAALPADTDLIFLDDPVFFAPLVQQARQLQIPMVHLCHNLEAFCLMKQEPAVARRVMAEEIELLAMADLIVTISREETSFLTNLGLPVIYFPYFPPAAIARRLSRIRQVRLETPKEGLLLLGSVTNPATRTGFRNFLRDWRDRTMAQLNEPLLVAGFGTRLEDIPEADSRIIFLGELDAERLDRTLTEVKACVCYQEHGGGALTRICEMLLAGVPVLANTHAGRSYYHVPGVIIFDELAELGNALAEALAWEGCIPSPARPERQILARAVETLLNGATGRTGQARMNPPPVMRQTGGG